MAGDHLPSRLCSDEMLSRRTHGGVSMGTAIMHASEVEATPLVRGTVYSSATVLAKAS